MKRIICVCMLCLILAVTGCKGTEVNKDVNQTPGGNAGTVIDIQDKYFDIYRPVLSTYYELLQCQYGNDLEIPEGHTGTSEATLMTYGSDAIKNIGFGLIDLSGDSVPELIIGEVYDELFNSGYNCIYAIYSCVKDEAVLVADCHARNQYNYLGNGNFYYYGSSGAKYTSFGTCHLDEDGCRFIWNDYYFTEDDLDEPDQLGIYYNNTGIPDPEKAEKLDISLDELWLISDELGSQTKPVSLNPFTLYNKIFGDEVEVCFEEDLDPDYKGIAISEKYVIDDGEGNVNLAFTTEKNVSDFKVLAISITDATDDGKIIFDKKVIYEANEFGPKHYLSLKLTFYGDIPAYAISYINEKGEEKVFAIELSGFDGRPTLEKIA